MKWKEMEVNGEEWLTMGKFGVRMERVGEISLVSQREQAHPGGEQ